MKLGGNLHSPFFDGVVENVDDPRGLGRVQVRVFGQHPAQKQKSDAIGVPVEDLPWMMPIQDIRSAAISGVGFSPTGITRGSFVVGYWRDKWHQDGMIIGTVAGEYVEQPDTQKGFCDPMGEYPRYVGNDVNSLALGGLKGKGSSSVIIRDSNTSIAVNQTIAHWMRYQKITALIRVDLRSKRCSNRMRGSAHAGIQTVKDIRQLGSGICLFAKRLAILQKLTLRSVKR